MTLILGAPRGLRSLMLPLAFLIILLILLASHRDRRSSDEYFGNLGFPLARGGKEESEAASHGDQPVATPKPPRYKPTATWQPADVTDPFPLLATSTATPPPIPPYNKPRQNLHHEYGLSYTPPLFIGFTRQWPMLLQCVVSYITAGWPPESIIVVENTGVMTSNADGLLGLQNPFYLNHTTLQRLGVTVLQTPVLLTFSQLQNFFLATAHARDWPYYFYSHQDVLVFSFEDGADIKKRPGDREWTFYNAEDESRAMQAPAAGHQGYTTIYENCLHELNRTLERGERWGFRWFQYDHLTLVNRAALDSVGGWDSMMPYYGSDCDMNARLAMDGWSRQHRRVGIINDVSTVLVDLAALYRDRTVTLRYSDPNPIPDAEQEEKETRKSDGLTVDGLKETIVTRKSTERAYPGPKGNKEVTKPRHHTPSTSDTDVTAEVAKSVEYFRELVKVGDEMGAYKYRDSDRARNSWQASQHGGQSEPYYYPSEGFTKSFWILAEAGREVYRQKWGHRECDLVEETELQLDDQWRVENDWDD